MLGTHGHWAVRVLWRSAHILWHGTSVYYGYLRDPWHSHLALLASFWQWSCHYTCFNDYQVCHGWDSNTQPSACGLSFYLLFGANTLTGFITTAAGNWPARSSVYFRLSFFVLVSPSGFEYQCDFGELTLGNLRLLCLYTRSLSLKRQNQICRINFTTVLTKSSSEILNFLGGYKCKIYNMTTSCHIVNVVYMTKIRRILA